MQAFTRTQIQILDSTLTPITTVKAFIPISKSVMFTYSKELSDFGQCKFRISSYDPLFKDFGDILQPHQNHIRIYRDNVLIWAGAIIENSKRTMDYVEVIGAEYEWYLNKILIQRSGVDPLGTFPTNPPGSTFNSTPTTFSSPQSNQIKFTFNTNIPFPVSIGQTITMANFGDYNGTWEIVAHDATSITVVVNQTVIGGNVSPLQPIALSNNIYRIFNCDTMGVQVTNVMNETITTMKGISGVHPLANMTLGEIDTPNYPPNTTNAANPPAPLTGAYTFGTGINAPLMQFDFHTILYVLKSFGNVSYADFAIDENLVFTFLSFFGNDKHYDVNFTWGEHGNAVDFNWPRLGQMQANDILGIATDIGGNILHFEQTDQASITTSGLLQAVAAYADIKDQATLNARVQAELPLVSKPEESPSTFTLNEKAPPFGVYDIGDIVTCNVNHKFLTTSAVKRIVGITVAMTDQGREMVTVQLNTPLPWQYGSTGQN